MRILCEDERLCSFKTPGVNGIKLVIRSVLNPPEDDSGVLCAFQNAEDSSAPLIILEFDYLELVFAEPPQENENSTRNWARIFWGYWADINDPKKDRYICHEGHLWAYGHQFTDTLIAAKTTADYHNIHNYKDTVQFSQNSIFYITNQLFLREVQPNLTCRTFDQNSGIVLAFDASGPSLIVINSYDERYCTLTIARKSNLARQRHLKFDIHKLRIQSVKLFETRIYICARSTTPWRVGGDCQVNCWPDVTLFIYDTLLNPLGSVKFTTAPILPKHLELSKEAREVVEQKHMRETTGDCGDLVLRTTSHKPPVLASYCDLKLRQIALRLVTKVPTCDFRLSKINVLNVAGHIHTRVILVSDQLHNCYVVVERGNIWWHSDTLKMFSQGQTAKGTEIFSTPDKSTITAVGIHGQYHSIRIKPS